MGAEPDWLVPSRALSQAELRPRKRLGQNFLQDRGVLRRITAAAELQPAHQVVELGAGTGALSVQLAAAVARLVAVELDDKLVPVLREALASFGSARVWHGNALAFDPCREIEGDYKLLGNIPYYVTGPIVRRFLETECPPALAVLLVQLEVAQRMAAPPGRYSLLTVAVRFFADVEVLFRVPPGAFYPRPKVTSAVIRLRPHRRYRDQIEPARFFLVARAGFSAKRKQVANALASGLNLSRDTVTAALDTAGVDPTRRAETLSIEEWVRLAQGPIGEGAGL